MQDDVAKPAKTVRMALQAPIAGSGPDAADAYVASLSVEILIDGRSIAVIEGERFETIAYALRIGHLAFSPRSRAFKPGSMDCDAFVRRMDLHWSAVDACGREDDRLTGVAEALRAAAAGRNVIAWSQEN